ncbi:MAG: hypothetical protein ABIG32_03715 [Candidatus Uhrbacteria bacterium]|nr:hypothetical protein [Patescibacteria group bacterium]MBU1907245.1 hypothetical protein [Patescibacteria group bacterium]
MPEGWFGKQFEALFGGKKKETSEPSKPEEKALPEPPAPFEQMSRGEYLDWARGVSKENKLQLLDVARLNEKWKEVHPEWVAEQQLKRAEAKEKVVEVKEVERLDIKVIPPKLQGKGVMIGFEGATEADCKAYNQAIDEVLTSHGYDAFHQVGEKNKPGYHAWEMRSEKDATKFESIPDEVRAKIHPEAA